MTLPLEQLRAALADRYEIEREIGSGGMATVYLARDVRHKREVALKVLRPELGAVLGTERFLAEITVTANLQHPNLLPLFDSGEADGLLFYVMPFVRGETLRAKIEREQQLSCEEAVRFAVAVASALQHAHEHGVVHRDLKPENILIHSGQPVIADFGIALAVSKAGGARVTQTGLSLGTPQYMSPEQATGEREIDSRSDIYSMGAVTYEMLAGEPPHSGSSAQAIIAKLMTSEPQPLHTLRSSIPNNVVCAVEKALAKLPADRFATAQDFASALQNPAFTVAARYGRPTAEQSLSTKKWKRFAISAGAVALAFIALALWSLFRPTSPRPAVRYVLTTDSTHVIGGFFGAVAISPDGRRLAYTILPGQRLIVRDRDKLTGEALSGAGLALSPFFSTDGARIGYFSPPNLLKVVSLNGGPPVVIADAIYGAGGCFGPDGDIYATSLLERAIVRISDSPRSAPKRITRVDSAAGETAHLFPELLPGGKAILFSVVYGGSVGNGKSPAVAVADIATGEHRVLVSGLRAKYSPSGHLLYVTSEGTLMTVRFGRKSLQLEGNPVAVAQNLRIGAGARATDFGVTADGTLFYLGGIAGSDREAVWVSRDGKIQQVDPLWKGIFSSPALSPDGKRLAVTDNTETRSDVWVKQLDNGPSLKLTFDGTLNIYPVWTPDGQSITYDGDDFGSEALWTKRADGSAQAVLQLRQARDPSEGLWSRDGKWLVIRTSVTVGGSGDILAIRPGVDSVPVSLVATQFGELSPTLSPDGRWMAYSSNETGRFEIYVVPFPNASAAKWAISTGGGIEPVWSRSGRELYYRSGGNLVTVAVKTNPTFSAGATTVLFSAQGFNQNPNHRQYDVTADDKRFIFVRNMGGTSDRQLVLVDNWFTEVKKK